MLRQLTSQTKSQKVQKLTKAEKKWVVMQNFLKGQYLIFYKPHLEGQSQQKEYSCTLTLQIKNIIHHV